MDYKDRELIFYRAKQCIQEKNWIVLREVIESATGYEFVIEELIGLILPTKLDPSKTSDNLDGEEIIDGSKKIPADIVDFVLNKFSTSDTISSHSDWTHCLSHFTRKLWLYSLHHWIKRFNEQAFGNAEKGWGFGRAYGCCDRLVVDVTKYGNWDTDPATIGLTNERIQKIADEYNQYYVARASALPFASAVAADTWKAKWYLSDPAEILHQVDSSEISDFVAEQMGVLVKAGEDTSMYIGLAERLLEEAEK